MLEPHIRGTLDNIIDKWLQALPDRIRSARKKGTWAPQVQNEIDYTLGYSHGAVKAGFIVAFTSTYNIFHNDEVMEEVDWILFNRTPQFKDAILKSG
jgi:hypothetical protein